MIPEKSKPPSTFNMSTNVDSGVPSLNQHLMPRSSLIEGSSLDGKLPSHPTEEPHASVEPDTSTSFDELLLSRHIPPAPMTASPTKEDGAATDVAAISSSPGVESLPRATPLRLEVGHDHSKVVAASAVALPEKSVSGESMPEKAIYPPPVSPTQTYQPPAPSLSMIHASKSPTSVNPPTSIFNRRSWHPSEYEHTSTPISPMTASSGMINRSSSPASSGASSAYSADSATIQIPQPGTNAYPRRNVHKRQNSDPKYVRFMSAVSENQKQTEPERYLGYPGLVSHMTESQHLIFRRFDDVHVRLLLYLQDQISQLESQLRTLDEQNIAEKGMHNGTFREDVDQLRVDIMERLRILVGEYDTMILAFSRMQDSKASEKAVGRLKEWLRKYSGAPAGRQSPTKGGAIAKNELEWMEKANDLTSLSTTTSASSTVVKQSPLTRLFPGRKR